VLGNISPKYLQSWERVFIYCRYGNNGIFVFYHTSRGKNTTVWYGSHPEWLESKSTNIWSKTGFSSCIHSRIFSHYPIPVKSINRHSSFLV